MGVGQNSFMKEKAVNIGVYSVGSQARGFFLHGISAPPPYLGQDYEQNGFGEKRGMVRLNFLVQICVNIGGKFFDGKLKRRIDG